ncbi:MAG: hypothetical protein LBS16_03410 [Prevotellaceae bacterium]|jgi:hypothetical protein|nr:hypothetical protein [Prevotellaceae bacterium]
MNKFIDRSLLGAVVLTLFAAVCWFLPLVFLPAEPQTIINVQWMGEMVHFAISPVWARVLQFLLICLFGYWWRRLLVVHQLIAIKNYLPYTLFIMLVTFNAEYTQFSIQTVILVFYMLALQMLFRIPTGNNYTIRAMNITTLLTIAATFEPEFIYMIPLFWWGFAVFNVMSWQVFFASLLGVGGIAIVMACLCYLCDRMDIIFHWIDNFPLPAIGEWFLPDKLSTQLFWIVFLLTVLIAVVRHAFSHLRLLQKVRLSHTYLVCLAIVLVLLRIGGILFPHGDLMIWLFLSSFLALFFAECRPRAATIGFILFLVAEFLTFIFHLTTLQ